MEKFVIASGNEGKIKEFETMLAEMKIKILPYKKACGDFEIEENGKTFEENALIKARAVAAKTDLPVFADDSGFCIAALDNFPGLITSRFEKEQGGIENAFKEIKKRMVGKKDLNASFVCVIAFIDKDKKEHIFKGVCNGFLADSLRGSNGFCYDTMFIPNGYGMTFAEMEESEKASISHRGIAVQKFIDFLKERMENLKNKNMVKKVADNNSSADDFNIEVDKKF